MKHILIADDEGFIRKGLIRNIKWEELGIDLVEQADDGINAYDKALEINPDILITDIRMPRMDGIELASKMRETFPRCRIIFMSAYSDKEYLKSAIHLKAVSYVEKPINLTEITQAIRQAAEACDEEERARDAAERAEKNLKESLEILKNNIALELIHSHMNRELVAKWLDAAGIHISDEGLFSVVLVKLDPGNRSGDAGAFEPAAALAIVEQVLSASRLLPIAGTKDRENLLAIACLDANPDAEAPNRALEDSCREVLQILEEQVDAFLSIGQPERGIDNIYKSYQSAVLYSQQLFYTGYGRLVTSAFHGREPYEPEEGGFDEFSGYLENGDREALLAFIEKLTIRLKNSGSMLSNHVKHIYFRLLQKLLGSAEKRRIRLSADNAEGFFWEELSSFDTLDKIVDYLLKLVNSYFSQIGEADGVSRTISDIIKIIETNYGDKELSIRTISEKLYFMSHSYLCVIFKKETGKTINQYITEFRIDKAKEFLGDRTIKLYDVATRVGYADQNYFTKIFKKVTGMTPSDYREKCL